MEPKVVVAGKPIEITIEPSLGGAGGRTLLLTILEEMTAGSDRRVYKVKDQHGTLYAYKHMKKRDLKKEAERTGALSKAGVPFAAMVTLGREPEERGAGYTIRQWIEGVRGDDWLRAWESFGSSVQADAIGDLLLLLDTLASKGLYVGKLDPEDMVFCPSFLGSPRWVIVDCGSIKYDVPPHQAGDRYFWKFVERWGMKLDRKGPAFLNLFKLLAPIGMSFPRPEPLTPPTMNPHLAVTKTGDEDEDEDEEDEEDDGESEISEGMKPVVVANVSSAYPSSAGRDPQGFRGGSYEILRDGTERINGVVQKPADVTVFEGGRLEPLPANVSLDMNSSYGKGPIKESTTSKESATPTVEESKNPDDEVGTANPENPDVGTESK